MLRYTSRQLELAGRHYLLLPKLNGVQLDLLAARLKRVGYAVEEGPLMTARNRKGSLTVDPRGLCWGPLDPADAILPAVPGVLGAPKEPASLAEVRSLYYRVAKEGSKTLLRLSTRLEASASWDKLRSIGECGLAPDEHRVAVRLLESVDHPCRVVTDFPVDDSAPFRAGRATLFVSYLSGPEVASTLRAGGEAKARNSYLPRNGVVEIRGPGAPSLDGGDLDDLGEWCSFRRTG